MKTVSFCPRGSYRKKKTIVKVTVVHHLKEKRQLLKRAKSFKIRSRLDTPRPPLKH